MTLLGKKPGSTEEREESRSSGLISVSLLAAIIGAVILSVTLLLFLSMRLTVDSFHETMRATDAWLFLRDAATELQKGSDQLTEQVRFYAVTGEKQYLEGYFEEADITKRRDRAIESLQQEASGTDAERYLQTAMQYSTNLMDREYYAMCLVLSAQGEDPAAWPAVLQPVKLSPEDIDLPEEEKMKKALTMVTDASYQEEKWKIQSNTDRCVEDLLGRMKTAQEISGRQLGQRLRIQLVMVAVLLLGILSYMLFVHFAVISPMKRAVEFIQDNSCIPMEGGREFRFLANTINVMHEKNQKQTGKLAFESTHDPVTGIYNRVGYEHLLGKLDLSHAAFLLVDIDLFKQVNDTYGHEVGDQVLAEVASALLSNFRPQDYICRIGGDEFAVIANHIGEERADTLVRKITQINTDLQNIGVDIPAVTISAGVAFGDCENDADEIFQKADAALYEVKRGGRGGAAVYRGELKTDGSGLIEPTESTYT